LRDPRPEDFITYQLPYAYDPTATAPMFEKFLNQMQPDKQCRDILAEYLAYVFVRTSKLKLEKVLLLYGTGANGKSVFFEISKAIFGQENVSSYSLQSLTDTNGYFRSQLANVLLNYASEINGRLETQYFKALASGEDLEARQPYGLPFVLRDYAKLIFNCNELPGEVEHTHAYFRRFIIIPFLVTLAENEQDKELSQKIIEAELPGVLNWILVGLNRLLSQKRFTESDAAARQLDEFKRHSDNVRCFVEDEGYQTSTDAKQPLKEMYREFANYCRDNGACACAIRKFADRLRNLGFQMHKTNIGQVVYASRHDFK
jgi:putative DNA primase/helicase